MSFKIYFPFYSSHSHIIVFFISPFNFCCLITFLLRILFFSIIFVLILLFASNDMLDQFLPLFGFLLPKSYSWHPRSSQTNIELETLIMNHIPNTIYACSNHGWLRKLLHGKLRVSPLFVLTDTTVEVEVQLKNLSSRETTLK